MSVPADLACQIAPKSTGARETHAEARIVLSFGIAFVIYALAIL